MKKIPLTMIAILFLMFFVAGTVKASTSSPPSWDLTGTYTVAIPSPSYIHSMTISSMNLATGGFIGTGSYSDGTNYVDWKITGTVTGSQFASIISYGTTTNVPGWAGYQWNWDGSINSTGQLIGNIHDAGGTTYAFNTTAGQASAVPIPGSALLLGSGVMGLLGFGRRKAQA